MISTLWLRINGFYYTNNYRTGIRMVVSANDQNFEKKKILILNKIEIFCNFLHYLNGFPVLKNLDETLFCVFLEKVFSMFLCFLYFRRIKYRVVQWKLATFQMLHSKTRCFYFCPTFYFLHCTAKIALSNTRILPVDMQLLLCKRRWKKVMIISRIIVFVFEIWPLLKLMVLFKDNWCLTCGICIWIKV
mgnify:CR=1 FL=1